MKAAAAKNGFSENALPQVVCNLLRGILALKL